MNWEVLTTAPNQLIAESWCGLIRSAGIDCKLQPGDAIGFMGVSVLPVRIMVRTSHVESAQSVLDSFISAPGENAPETDDQDEPE